MSAVGGKGLLPPRGILPKACPMKAHEDHSALIRLVAVELSACGMTLESLCDTREGHVARQYTIAVVTPKKKSHQIADRARRARVRKRREEARAPKSLGDSRRESSRCAQLRASRIRPPERLLQRPNLASVPIHMTLSCAHRWSHWRRGSNDFSHDATHPNSLSGGVVWERQVRSFASLQ